VIASGAFGWGFSAVAGLLGSEEHPAINPAARIATNSFFINDFPIRLSVVVGLSIRDCRFANHCTEPRP
jgi:hypothetical protein